jgi:hypothetical protein
MDEFSTKSECSDQESVPTRHSNMWSFLSRGGGVSWANQMQL